MTTTTNTTTKQPTTHKLRDVKPITDPEHFARRSWLRDGERARLYVTIRDRLEAWRAAKEAERERDHFHAVLTQIWSLGVEADPVDLVELAATAVKHGPEHGATVGRDIVGRHAMRLREEIREVALERDMVRATSTQELARVEAESAPSVRTARLGRWVETQVATQWPEVLPLIEGGGWMTGPEVARAARGDTLDVPSTVAGLSEAKRAGLIWSRFRGDGVEVWTAVKPRPAEVADDADVFLANLRRRSEAGDLSAVTDEDLRALVGEEEPVKA